MNTALPLNSIQPRLVLASSSPYRRELLERLGIPFEVKAPRVDETAQRGESPIELVGRLARAKALAISKVSVGQFTIGSDQVVDMDGEAVSKPGSFKRACAQLRAASGRQMYFHTALCVVAPDGRLAERVIDTEVRFRTLDEATIEAYVRYEAPYDCAGAFKIERLGIALVTSIRCPDPTALIGLPLIALTELLEELEFSVIAHLPT